MSGKASSESGAVISLCLLAFVFAFAHIAMDTQKELDNALEKLHEGTFIKTTKSSKPSS